MGRLTGLQDSSDYATTSSSPASAAGANSLAATLASAATLVGEPGAAGGGSNGGGVAPGGEAGPGSSSAGSSGAGGKSGTHVYLVDPRNADVLVGIRDGMLDTFDLVWRPQVGCWVGEEGEEGGGGGGAQSITMCMAMVAVLGRSLLLVLWLVVTGCPAATQTCQATSRLVPCAPYCPLWPSLLSHPAPPTSTPQARVSVLDSAFMLGDGVWEGLRVVGGVVAFAAAHLGRLWEGAKALDMDLGLTQAQLLNMIYATLDANGMGNASGEGRGGVGRGGEGRPKRRAAAVGMFWGEGHALIMSVALSGHCEFVSMVTGPFCPIPFLPPRCLVGRCPCAADGVAWPQAHPLPGPRHHPGQAHHRDPARVEGGRPRAQGSRHPPVHGACAARGAGCAGPRLEQPQQAQLHLRLHTGEGQRGAAQVSTAQVVLT